MELFLPVPDLLLALKTPLTEVWSNAKSPAAPLGLEYSVLMCSGLCHCGSVTLQLLFLLTSCLPAGTAL